MESNEKDIYTNKIDIFCLLRAIAILCIFFLHANLLISANHTSTKFQWWILTPAWSGIWILIILSGYLLGKGFYTNKYKTDVDGMKFFWLNRFIRIVPLYYFFTFLMFLFVDTQHYISGGVKSILPLIFFYFNGSNATLANGQTWFISTIMQLYLLTPLVYRFIIKKIQNINIYITFFLLLVFGLSLRLVQFANNSPWDTITYKYFYYNLDLFFGGFLLNAITQNSYNSKIKEILRPLSLILFFSCIILNARFMWTTIILHNPLSTFICQYIYPSVYLIFISLVIFAFDYKDKPKNLPLNFKNILKNPLRLIEAFGLISFGFYLFHQIILGIFTKYMNFSTPVYIIISTTLTGFILTTCMATITYFTIEKPCNKFRYNINKGKKND